MRRNAEQQWRDGWGANGRPIGFKKKRKKERYRSYAIHITSLEPLSAISDKNWKTGDVVLVKGPNETQ